MSNKRTLKNHTVQTDFWTALPIDECRQRLMALQRSNSVSEYKHKQPLFTGGTQIDQFDLVRVHRLAYWQRKYWPFGTRFYPLHVDGELQATADGTHVTLWVAPQTNALLHRQAIISRWNVTFSALLVAFIFCVIVAQLLGMILFGESFVIYDLISDGSDGRGLFILFLGMYFAIIRSGVSGSNSLRTVLDHKTQSTIYGIHDALYVPGHPTGPQYVNWIDAAFDHVAPPHAA